MNSSNSNTGTHDYLMRLEPASATTANLSVSGNINAASIGIGKTPDAAYKLDVCGDIRARQLKITSATGCDFVFEKKYELPSLQWRKQFMEKNRRLPNVKSAKEMEENGIDVAENSSSILRNVEEHELYLYQHDERIGKVEEENTALKKEIAELRKEIKELKKQIKK